ncbi:VanZ family protein [Candidatus Sumerlaeota bacterium]|nr:VanZ family protein [Candidatus Sumerlaeota bacterium]
MLRTINSLIDRAIALTPQRMWWVYSVVCAVIILYVGGRPGSAIPNLSFIKGLDKVLHFTAYSGLAVCLFRACYPLQVNHKPTLSLPWLPVILGPLLVGLIDEIHQAFVPGRGSDPKDLIADTMGGVLICATGVYWRWQVLERDRQRHNSRR